MSLMYSHPEDRQTDGMVKTRIVFSIISSFR
jgi:hypothetical protein